MALVLVEGSEVTYPVFVCDYCGKEIDDAELGNYLWQRGGTKKITDIKFLHKIACTQAYEKTVGRFDSCDGIDSLLVYLLANTGMTKEKLNQTRERVKSLRSL